MAGSRRSSAFNFSEDRRTAFETAAAPFLTRVRCLRVLAGSHSLFSVSGHPSGGEPAGPRIPFSWTSSVYCDLR